MTTKLAGALLSFSLAKIRFNNKTNDKIKGDGQEYPSHTHQRCSAPRRFPSSWGSQKPLMHWADRADETLIPWSARIGVRGRAGCRLEGLSHGLVSQSEYRQAVGRGIRIP